MNQKMLDEEYDRVLSSIKSQYPFLEFNGNSGRERVLNLIKYKNSSYEKSAIQSATFGNLDSLKQMTQNITIEKAGSHYKNYLINYLLNQFIFHYLNNPTSNFNNKKMHFISKCYLKEFKRSHSSRKINLNVVNFNDGDSSIRDKDFYHTPTNGINEYEENLEKFFSKIEDAYSNSIKDKKIDFTFTNISCYDYMRINSFLITHEVRLEKNNDNYSVRTMENFLILQEKYLLRSFQNQYIIESKTITPITISPLNITRIIKSGKTLEYIIFPITQKTLLLVSNNKLTEEERGDLLTHHQNKIIRNYHNGENIYGMTSKSMKELINSHKD